jgi:hypothetical protein
METATLASDCTSQRDPAGQAWGLGGSLSIACNSITFDFVDCNAEVM